MKDQMKKQKKEINKEIDKRPNYKKGKEKGFSNEGFQVENKIKVEGAKYNKKKWIRTIMNQIIKENDGSISNGIIVVKKSRATEEFYNYAYKDVEQEWDDEAMGYVMKRKFVGEVKYMEVPNSWEQVNKKNQQQETSNNKAADIKDLDISF